MTKWGEEKALFGSGTESAFGMEKLCILYCMKHTQTDLMSDQCGQRYRFVTKLTGSNFR